MSYDGTVTVRVTGRVMRGGSIVRIRIERADPYVTINDSVLDLAADGARWLALDDDNMTLAICDDFGQQYIYRLDWYDAERHCWGASWPD